MNTTIGILGSNLGLTTEFIENIIKHTKAKVDQDHIKMNIIVNNKLLNKTNNEIIDILNRLKESNINYLVLTDNNSNLYNLVLNSNINLINKTFNINDETLIKEIIHLCGKEYIE